MAESGDFREPRGKTVPLSGVLFVTFGGGEGVFEYGVGFPKGELSQGWLASEKLGTRVSEMLRGSLNRAYI